MRTRMNFVTPTESGEVRFVLDNGWTGTAQRAVEIELTDARPTAASLSLDVEGFAIDRIVSGVTDFRDAAQVTERWNSAVKETVLRVTGGSWATLFAGPNTRFSERDPAAFASPVSAPARAVHSDLHGDFTLEQLGAQPFGEAAEAELRARYGDRQPARWRVFNIWQMISAPPQDTSLALCALDSLSEDDVVEGRGFFAEPGASSEEVLARDDMPHQFDITFFRADPRQRWFYFSDMLPGEALIFSAFDPNADTRRSRVPHGAVDVPDRGRVTVPRNSIETRALVAFD